MSYDDNVAILAAWCESESHLESPAGPLSATSLRTHDALLGSPPSAALTGSAYLGHQRRFNRLTVAELSQLSVDLLLREYYQMMHTAPEIEQSTGVRVEGPSMNLRKTFLLFCPVLPSCFDLQTLLAAAMHILQAASKLLVLSSCLIVPFWLTLIREQLQQQQIHSAVVLTVRGLIVLVLADVVHRRQQTAQRSAALRTVTAATLQLPQGSQHAELCTLRQASKTASTPNTRKLASAHHQAQLQQPQPDPFNPTTPSSAPRADAANGSPSYIDLLPALAALQSALGLPGSARSVNSTEQLTDELRKVCTTLGVAVTPDMTANPAALAATIAQLQSSIGF